MSNILPKSSNARKKPAAFLVKYAHLVQRKKKKKKRYKYSVLNARQLKGHTRAKWNSSVTATSLAPRS